MGILKNICLRVALNKEQRLVIWNALQYSDHKYRAHGNVDRAVVTSMVIAQTEKWFGVNEKNFTKEEVNAILDEFARRVKAERKEELHDAYQAGRGDAIREMLENIKHGRGLAVGEVVEMEEEPEEKEEKQESSAPEPSTAPEETERAETEHQQDAGEQ
jgi:hypothetical protein